MAKRNIMTYEKRRKEEKRRRKQEEKRDRRFGKNKQEPAAAELPATEGEAAPPAAPTPERES